jgi:beta-aspartyl-peptidase (threonine type)
MTHPVIAIHGGCGTLAAELLPPAEWAEVREHLANSLRAGWRVLGAGGRALDAVQAAVVVMEDSPHFNAGYGAALCEDGTHELDASIMDGATLGAGAVCAARRLKNPIVAARAVMERSGCVLLAGNAADEFGRRVGLSIVDNRYFTTERRVLALAKLRAAGQRGVLGAAGAGSLATTATTSISEADRHGTVGAVALDAAGHLAAATSTGGFNNKPVGRVGDSPIIGAGTYARDGVCAVSCTGQGEVFVRHVVAHEIAARMRHGGQSLDQATQALMQEHIAPHRIGAGLVAVDGQGHIVAPFNTLGMARGWIDGRSRLHVATHGDVFDLGPA